MSTFQLVDIANHRSRDRIRDLGEVFTPDKYVHALLDCVSPAAWADENCIFFEPTCGHGNIAIPLLDRRIEALTKKFTRMNTEAPRVSAVATAFNTFWAIDICPMNVELTRKRALDLATAALLKPPRECSNATLRDFLKHLICTLFWQITENEALSALSDETKAREYAHQTRVGDAWLAAHNHKPINFSDDWCAVFKDSKSNGTIHSLFHRVSKFLDSTETGSSPRIHPDLAFAKDSITALLSRNRTSGAA